MLTSEPASETALCDEPPEQNDHPHIHAHQCSSCWTVRCCRYQQCLEDYAGPFKGGKRIIVEQCKKCIKSSPYGHLTGTMND